MCSYQGCKNSVFYCKYRVTSIYSILNLLNFSFISAQLIIVMCVLNFIFSVPHVKWMDFF